VTLPAIKIGIGEKLMSRAADEENERRPQRFKRTDLILLLLDEMEI
jgi:hypothetical protein